MSDPRADSARRALDGPAPDRDEAIALADTARDRPIELIHQAWQIRRARFGRRVSLCAIVPGKLGGCGEDCAFCAQSARRGGGAAKSTRTPTEQIVAAAADARRNGAARIGIVNSGRRPSEADLAAVCDAAAAIAVSTPIALCASLGELTGEQARALAAAGVRRYNHNLETCRRLHPRIVTTHTFDDRLRTLAACRRAGLEVCCGGIFGVGETWADRADLALALRDEVRPRTVPINFLHPIPGTPLAGATPLRPLEALAVIALFRLLLPDADIKVAGGREAVLRDLQSWMFHAGATSAIVGDYLTTAGRAAADDLRMIADLDLELTDDLRAAPS